jgi:hypothetical protein
MASVEAQLNSITDMSGQARDVAVKHELAAARRAELYQRIAAKDLMEEAGDEELQAMVDDFAGTMATIGNNVSRCWGEWRLGW